MINLDKELLAIEFPIAPELLEALLDGDGRAVLGEDDFIHVPNWQMSDVEKQVLRAVLKIYFQGNTRRPLLEVVGEFEADFEATAAQEPQP